PQSVDALFAEGQRRGMRMAAGKVLMDRNAPEALRDSAQSAYDDSKALIARWHGHGRAVARAQGCAPSHPHCREQARDRVDRRAVSRAEGLSRRLRSSWADGE